VAALTSLIITRRRGLPDEQTLLAQYNAKVERDEAKFKAGLDKLHAKFGLKMSTVSATGQVVVGLETLFRSTRQQPVWTTKTYLAPVGG
jgi:hypothetical protein